MADRIILFRATDAANDIVAGAQAWFYESGTTTPVDVYSDAAGTTPITQPLEADAEGVFAPTFASGLVKVIIKDTDGVELPGFESDPHYYSNATATGANAIAFSPITGNPATNVQAAVANNTSLAVANAAALATVAADALTSDDIIDEDDMASDSDTKVPLQGNVKAFVEAAIAAADYTPAFVAFDGAAVTISHQKNVSSITRSATGRFWINFATALPDANYVVTVTLGVIGSANGFEYTWKTTNKEAGRAEIYCLSAGSASNFDDINVVIHRVPA